MPSIDLKEAEAILDEDHYGLKKVKERIIQQLAVMALNKKQSGSILLFVERPGTGKTSIGQSIAKALGRKYVRISLGGVGMKQRSGTPAYLCRGYARTYLEGMKRSGASNLLWSWMRWINWPETTAAILPVLFWKFWIRNRTTALPIIHERSL